MSIVFIATNFSNQLSVTNDYHYILVMLLGLSRNSRLEVTQFSVPTISGAVSIIRRDAPLPGWQHQAALTLAQCVKARNGSLMCPQYCCSTWGLQV